MESISRSITERNKLLVDLGCGFGWHWVDMARLYPSVKFLLVDFSISNLLVCRSIMPFKDYPNVLCFHADISSLPVRGGVSDFCWSVQVIQHLPEEKRKAAFEEIKRIQKPGAGFYVAWVRPVPLIRLAYSLLGRKYHVKGVMRDEMFLQRFDDEIEADLKSFFKEYHLQYSETLFYPELKISPRSGLVEYLDMMIGKTFLAKWLARQTEIWGCT